MESELQLDNHSIDSSIIIKSETKNYILSMVKWTKFISILSIVLILIYTISFIASSIKINLFSNFIGIISTMYTLIVDFFYFILFKHLLDASSKLKIAVINEDSELLTEGLLSLKKHFKILGILTIVVLGMAILTFLFAFFGLTFIDMF
jgi:hypothetical protein